MNVYYDLHIHTALSPCADNDMTPCDIVGMAILNDLDVIAVTDHNSIANANAVYMAAQPMCKAHGRNRNLIVIPGAEVTTSEEVHVLCLFADIETALSFENDLSAYYSALKNRPDIFGDQLILGSDDSLAGTLDRMLAAPTSISFEELFGLTSRHGGAFVPAHADRESFSVMSNLGFLPPDLDIAAVQFTTPNSFVKDKPNYGFFPGKKYIFSSDAHQLSLISEKTQYLSLPELSARAVIDYLRF